MSEQYPDENWIRVRNRDFKQRVQQCLDDVNPENIFSVEEIYRVPDEPYELSDHFIIRIEGGRNGGVAWVDYTKDIHKIFKALQNRNKCHFLRSWLIKLENTMNDRFEMLIGIRDEEMQYPPLDPSVPRIIKKK